MLSIYDQTMILDESLKISLFNAKSYKEQQDALFEILKVIMTDYITVPLEQVLLESRFRDDLGVDSLEVVFIGDTLEKNFEFSFKEFPFDDKKFTLNKYIQITLNELQKSGIISAFQ